MDIDPVMIARLTFAAEVVDRAVNRDGDQGFIVILFPKDDSAPEIGQLASNVEPAFAADVLRAVLEKLAGVGKGGTVQ